MSIMPINNHTDLMEDQINSLPTSDKKNPKENEIIDRKEETKKKKVKKNKQNAIPCSPMVCQTNITQNYQEEVKKIENEQETAKMIKEELYPRSKKNFNTYNEVFQFFKYNKRPERIKIQQSFNNCKAEIQQRYRLINKSENSYSKSRLQIKLGNKVFKTIPFKCEIDKLIDSAHNGFEGSVVKHNGIKLTLKNLEGPSMLLYWANMAMDVKNYIENCIPCLENQPVKSIKVYKPIIPNGPFDHFTADLYTLNDKMLAASGTQHRYILSCVDHFPNISGQN